MRRPIVLRRKRALEQAVRELHACLVFGPDGCGALDPHPAVIEDYIADPKARAVARPLCQLTADFEEMLRP